MAVMAQFLKTKTLPPLERLLAKRKSELASHHGLEPTETCPVCAEIRADIETIEARMTELREAGV